jgi:hypothetical protein
VIVFGHDSQTFWRIFWCVAFVYAKIFRRSYFSLIQKNKSTEEKTPESIQRFYSFIFFASPFQLSPQFFLVSPKKNRKKEYFFFSSKKKQRLSFDTKNIYICFSIRIFLFFPRVTKKIEKKKDRKKRQYFSLRSSKKYILWLFLPILLPFFFRDTSIRAKRKKRGVTHRV